MLLLLSSLSLIVATCVFLYRRQINQPEEITEKGPAAADVDALNRRIHELEAEQTDLQQIKDQLQADTKNLEIDSSIKEAELTALRQQLQEKIREADTLKQKVKRLEPLAEDGQNFRKLCRKDAPSTPMSASYPIRATAASPYTSSPKQQPSPKLQTPPPGFSATEEAKLREHADLLREKLQLKHEKEQLQRQAQQATAESESAMARMREAVADRMDVEQRIAQLEASLHREQARGTELAAQLRSCQEEAAQLKPLVPEVEQLRAQVPDLIAQLMASQDELGELRPLADELAELQEHLPELQAAHQRLPEVEANLAELQQRMPELQEAYARVPVLQGELDELRGHIEEANAARARTEALEAELAELSVVRDELQQAQARLQELEPQAGELQARVAELEKRQASHDEMVVELEGLRAENDTLTRTALPRMAKKLKKAEEALKERDAEMAQLRAKLAEAAPAAPGHKRAKLEEGQAYSSIEQLEAELQEVQAELERLRAEAPGAVHLEVRILAPGEQAKPASADGSSGPPAPHNDLSTAGTAPAAQEGEAQEHGEDTAAQQEELSAAREELSTAREELAAQQEEIQRLQAKLAESEAAQALLQGKLDGSMKTVERLDSEVQWMQEARQRPQELEVTSSRSLSDVMVFNPLASPSITDQSTAGQAAQEPQVEPGSSDDVTAQLRRELEGCQQQLQVAQADLLAERGQLSAVREQLENAQQTAEKLQQQLDAELAGRTQAEAGGEQELQQEITGLRDALQQRDDELSVVRGESGKAQELLQQTRAVVQRFEQQLDGLKEDHMSMCTAITELDDDLEELSEGLGRGVEPSLALKPALEALRQKVRQLLGSLQALAAMRPLMADSLDLLPETPSSNPSRGPVGTPSGQPTSPAAPRPPAGPVAKLAAGEGQLSGSEGQLIGSDDLNTDTGGSSGWEEDALYKDEDEEDEAEQGPGSSKKGPADVEGPGEGKEALQEQVDLLKQLLEHSQKRGDELNESYEEALAGLSAANDFNVRLQESQAQSDKYAALCIEQAEKIERQEQKLQELQAKGAAATEAPAAPPSAPPADAPTEPTAPPTETLTDAPTTDLPSWVSSMDRRASTASLLPSSPLPSASPGLAAPTPSPGTSLSTLRQTLSMERSSHELLMDEVMHYQESINTLKGRITDLEQANDNLEQTLVITKEALDSALADQEQLEQAVDPALDLIAGTAAAAAGVKLLAPALSQLLQDLEQLQGSLPEPTPAHPLADLASLEPTESLQDSPGEEDFGGGWTLSDSPNMESFGGLLATPELEPVTGEEGAFFTAMTRMPVERAEPAPGTDERPVQRNLATEFESGE